MVGIARKKLYSPAQRRRTPKNSAATIVRPLRDMPGSSANACASPIASATIRVMSRRPRVRGPSRSLTSSRTPVIVKVRAITGGAPKACSKSPLSGSPTAPVTATLASPSATKRRWRRSRRPRARRSAQAPCANFARLAWNTTAIDTSVPRCTTRSKSTSAADSGGGSSEPMAMSACCTSTK